MGELNKNNINELVAIAQNPKESVAKAINDTGKKAVGCFPIYTPDEAIYALGLLPVGMWGGPVKGNLADKYLQTFCCSIMKANTEQALLGDYDLLSAVLVTSFCDTLKCIIEDWKVAVPYLHIVPIVYPQNRKTPSGRAYLKAEIERVSAQLEQVVGRKPYTEADLSAAVDLYDEYRAASQDFVKAVSEKPGLLTASERHNVIKAAYFMDKADYTPKLKAITEEIKKADAPDAKNLTKVVVSGIINEPDGLLDIFDETGFTIVGDDLAQETRQFRTIAPKVGTGIERMVERIALQDGCAFLYDDKKLRGQMIIDLVKKTGADAVFFNQLKFCDPEEFDWPIIKKELEAAKIPTLYIETEQQMDSFEQTRTRLQAFAEII
ncbi:MAG: 2-hydroxyacyl-CoA dehydratase family protein [Clostridiales Family XIII bacterium]|jgi:benzoyl-CoA reductase/2-hydroxyglutaryl-CoA dehydratase subunit BcrC/BadD/HgdB|nr:2-hydroxyacyl-CoA dehydratase family protein [Clostridiales Family XIII bacterium]